MAINISRRWRLAGASLVLSVLLALLLILPLSAQETTPAGATADQQAQVIVQLDAQAQLARAITFTEAISGLKALELTGLEIVTRSYNFGDAVCSIAGVGCPAEDCFCSTNYWSYWYWDGGAWQSYPVGAGSSVISQTGAVEGWRWGQFGDTLRPATATLQSQVALSWLTDQRASAGGPASASVAVEDALALGANQQYDEAINAYLAANGATYARISAAAAGKLAVALAAADACQPAGALTPASYYSPTLGAYSTQSGANVWALLGVVARNEPAPESAVDYLAAQTQPDGGWEWTPGWGSDSNTTALAIQALIAAGEPVSATTVISGLAYLANLQNVDGGFPYAAGDSAASDANSTAYVVQALVAAGEDLTAPRWTPGGKTPLDYLLDIQLADGSFEWQPGTGANLLATQQAVPALLGWAHPLARRDLVACPGVYLPLVHQN
jgi:hypothetical protein